MNSISLGEEFVVFPVVSENKLPTRGETRLARQFVKKERKRLYVSNITDNRTVLVTNSPVLFLLL